MRMIYRPAPCPNYDVERLESWLTDMAEKGLHLVSESNFLSIFTFEEGLPQNVRYRLEPKPKDGMDTFMPDTEAREMAEEFGWEFVDDYGQFYIYRSTAADATEFNTDCIIQSIALKNVRRRLLDKIAGQLVLVAHSLLRLMKEPFRYLVTFGPLYTIGFAVLMLLLFYGDIREFSHILALQKKLRKNEPLDHRKPWKKWAILHHIQKISSILFTVVIFGLVLNTCAKAWTIEKPSLADYPGNPPIVTIADLDPEGIYTPQAFLDNYDEYTQTASLFAPTILEWNEYGELTTADGEIYTGFIRVTYYETASPWLAEGLYRDYLRNAQRDKHYSLYSISGLNTDQWIAFNRIVPTVLIQQGNVMVEASISLDNEDGQFALEMWANRMAEKLLMEGGI